MKLLRLLGASFGLAVVVGGTIGTGILRTPGDVAAQLREPTWILLAWVAGAVYAALGAATLMELGAAVPLAGGFYVYVRRAFGPNAGFFMGWCDWLGQLAAVGFAAITIGEFSAELWPAAKGLEQAIAIGVIALFALLHWAGLRVSARAQELTSLVKALAFVALVIACFAFGKQATGRTVAFVPSAPAFFLAIQAILYTYDGWYNAVYFTEEDVSPGRNLARSMLGGVAAVAAIYLAINAAILYVLPADELAGSKLAAADAAARVFGDEGRRLITVLSLISLPPLMNAVLMMATRIAFAMSRDGFLLASLTTVNERGTPRNAMFWSCAVAAALVLTGTAGRLMAIATFFYVAAYTAGYLCVIRLRRSEPALDRPLHAFGYPWVTGFLIAGSVVFMCGAIVSDAWNSLWALALLLLGEPARRIFRR